MCQCLGIRLRGSQLCFTLLTVALSPAFGQDPPEFTHPATDPDQRLTAKQFFKDIGLSFAGLVSTHSVVPLAVGAAATAIATVPEQDLERHFARGEVWGYWADPGKYIGHPIMLGGISAAVFGLSRKSHDKNFRSFSYSLVQGLITTETISQSLKPVFHRLRPNGEDHGSFPSSHAVDTFMVATVVEEHYGWKAAIPAYTIASYVAATRLEERKHHLTDVAAGSAIGFLVGKTVSRRIRGGKHARFVWSIYPSGDGCSGTVRVMLP